MDGNLGNHPVTGFIMNKIWISVKLMGRVGSIAGFTTGNSVDLHRSILGGPPLLVGQGLLRVGSLRDEMVWDLVWALSSGRGEIIWVLQRHFTKPSSEYLQLVVVANSTSSTSTDWTTSSSRSACNLGFRRCCKPVVTLLRSSNSEDARRRPPLCGPGHSLRDPSQCSPCLSADSVQLGLKPLLNLA